MIDAVIDRIVSEYIDSLSYVRSIDGFLVKTTSLVLRLEELCKDDKCSVEEYLSKILRDERVRRYLAVFSCFKDNIVHMVSTDPRHKKLRKYLEILVDAFGEVECSGNYHAEVEVEAPTALWVKEYRERHVEAPRGISKEGKMLSGFNVFEQSLKDPEKIILYLLYASIILLLIYVLTR